jgi:preprotein translocase subunit SecA
MSATDVSQAIVDMRHEAAEDMVAKCIPPRAYPEQWDVGGLHEEVLRVFNIDLPIADWGKEDGIADQEIRHRVLEATDRKMAEKAANYGPEVMRMVEKSLLLQVLDQSWKDHLLTLDHLRQGIGLRAYGQRDPLNEYKREAFNLFEEMLAQLREKITSLLAHIELRVESGTEEMLTSRSSGQYIESREDPALVDQGAFAAAENNATATFQQPMRVAAVDPADPATWAATSRNAPCPCGSGKKYKHCHGAVS